jgi:hypothetical protein
LNDPARLSPQRRAAATEVFYRPGGATGRALRLIYDLLALPLRIEARQGVGLTASTEPVSARTEGA